MQPSTITFRREDTGETFTFGPTPPYMLHPNTKLPAPGTLAVSGMEYFGADGGMTLASRQQRQTAKIVYNVLEDYRHEKGMMSLIAAGTQFFQPHNADLSVIRYSMIVQTSDSFDEAYLMQHGAITVPFAAPLIRGQGLSTANEMDFIFDDPLRYWAGGEGVVSGNILPSLPAATLMGERWTSGLQTWTGGLAQWDYPKDGSGGTPQTVKVVSSVPVGVEIDIFGAIGNVRISNTTDGSYWQWDQMIPAGRAVHVASDGSARDWNGAPIYTALGALTAQPGANTFALTGTNVSGGYAKVTIRGAY